MVRASVGEGVHRMRSVPLLQLVLAVGWDED
jgi:hypothetical protein